MSDQSSRQSIDRLLHNLFGSDHTVHFDGPLLSGEALFDGGAVAVLGTSARVPIGASVALDLSRHVLDAMRHHPGRAILLVVENSGQKLSLFDELIGNNGYIAHLSTCLDAARRRGHKVIGLVHDLAISAGFMATGMATGDCYALEGAELRVMAREAMSRITRIPLERLDELSRTNPILGPGVHNFERIGAISGVWSGDLRQHLRDALASPDVGDLRRRLGAERGGRLLAVKVAQAVREGRQRL
jgi:malonate decarboxylase gamma subunit